MRKEGRDGEEEREQGNTGRGKKEGIKGQAEDGATDISRLIIIH